MFVRSSKLGQHLESSIKQHVGEMSQQLILNVGVSDKAEKLNQHCFTFAFCSSTLFIVFIMIAVESSVYCFDQKNLARSHFVKLLFGQSTRNWFNEGLDTFTRESLLKGKDQYS